MVEQVVIICRPYFFTFPLDFIFFLNLSWIGKLLPGESWLSLKKGNVWSVRSTNDQPVYWNSSKVHLMNHELTSSWSTTQCYIVWQWKDKELDGVNSQRDEEEEEEWGAWEWEFVAQQTGTSGGVGRLHCNSYSNACTVYPKDIFLCSHF